MEKFQKIHYLGYVRRGIGSNDLYLGSNDLYLGTII